MELERRAEAFATGAHERKGQVRKYTGEPYIEHPRAVVALVRSVPHDEAMLAAAWLHDTVEDTSATIADIEREFGHDVATLVGELTDVSLPSDGNRKARKTIDRHHLAVASPRAKTIKLADLIDNSRSIVERDPDFAKIYLEEKRALLAVLSEGDPTLLNQAREIAFGPTTTMVTRARRAAVEFYYKASGVTGVMLDWIDGGDATDVDEDLVSLSDLLLRFAQSENVRKSGRP